MKILVDMNLSPLWVEFLSGRGYHAVHWSDVGTASAADSEILDYAAAHNFVVFTHDLDFKRDPVTRSRCSAGSRRGLRPPRDRGRPYAFGEGRFRDRRPFPPAHSTVAHLSLGAIPQVQTATVSSREEALLQIGRDTAKWH